MDSAPDPCTVAVDPWARQAERFREQAWACDRLGSPMYAELLARMIPQIQEGGPVRDALVGHEHDSGPSALALRLLGAVHRLVLLRQAGALAASYPSVGGVFDPDVAWRDLMRLFSEQPDAVRDGLDHPPQTNEVGRSAALYGGLKFLTATHHLPVRLMEIGSSGGLNLRCDHYAYTDGDGRVHGHTDSPVRVQWLGPTPPGPTPRIIQRLGSDTAPVDASTTEGRVTLTAYVWPDQRDRHERLRGALQIASRVPVEVRRQDAASFVDDLTLTPGTVTVLAHSVMWQYLDESDQQRITDRLEELGRQAWPQAPLAYLRAEPMRPTPDADHQFLVALTTWSGREDPSRQILGELPPHGTPTTWH